ncbi:MAG: C_GCAxxG_C_C family protein [Candidatus Lokiarchaeota archaeon]|nr:C_GCAxxG_C_C family protein [Candidatus Lokiarchaeota archaeon]
MNMMVDEIQLVDKLFDEKIKELKEILPKKYLIAGDMLQYNCAALTMKHFLDIIKLEDLNLINMASPTAAVTGTCGAVNASLMIIGIIKGQYGKKILHQMNASAEAMKFIKRFKKEFGSYMCTDLTGCDLLKIEEMQRYRDEGIWSKQCYKHVIKSLDIIRHLYKKNILKLLK